MLCTVSASLFVGGKGRGQLSLFSACALLCGHKSILGTSVWCCLRVINKATCNWHVAACLVSCMFVGAPTRQLSSAAKRRLPQACRSDCGMPVICCLRSGKGIVLSFQHT